MRWRFLAGEGGFHGQPGAPPWLEGLAGQAVRMNDGGRAMGVCIHVAAGLFLMVLRLSSGPLEALTYVYDQDKDFCVWREFRRRAA